nr:choice-of-anchor H family protein [Shewanella violacea]
MNHNVNNNHAKAITGLIIETGVGASSASKSKLSCSKRISLLTLLVGACITFNLSAYASEEAINSSDTRSTQGVFSVGGQTPSLSAMSDNELDAQVGMIADENALLSSQPSPRLAWLEKKMITLKPSSFNPMDIKTREQVISEHKSGDISAKYSLQKNGMKTVADDAQSTVPKAFSNPIYHEFSIYEASSRLFVDDDGDGFYQTFSVTFDADVYGLDAVEVADVYAEIYLSRDGGPWVHYDSTDVFSIVGESSDDDYEVLTSLHYGYYTDYYDVLIDLYEVGFDDIVATISSNDTDNLYALPLESSDRDEVYIDGGDSSSEGYGGGAISLLSLLGLGIIASLRRKKCKY